MFPFNMFSELVSIRKSHQTRMRRCIIRTGQIHPIKLSCMFGTQVSTEMIFSLKRLSTLITFKWPFVLMGALNMSV